MLFRRCVLRPNTEEVIIVKFALSKGNDGNVGQENEFPSPKIVHNVSLVRWKCDTQLFITFVCCHFSQNAPFFLRKLMSRWHSVSNGQNILMEFEFLLFSLTLRSERSLLVFRSYHGALIIRFGFISIHFDWLVLLRFYSHYFFIRQRVVHIHFIFTHYKICVISHFN